MNIGFQTFLNILRSLRNPIKTIEGLLLQESSRWILWIPVLFGAGIGIGLTHPIRLWPCLGVTLLVITIGIWRHFQRSIISPKRWLTFLIIRSVFFLSSGIVWSIFYTQYLDPISHITQDTGVQYFEGRIRHTDILPSGLRLHIDHLSWPTDIPLEPAKPPHPQHYVSVIWRQVLSAKDKALLHPGAHIHWKGVMIPWKKSFFPGEYSRSLMARTQGCIAHGYGISQPHILHHDPVDDWTSRRHQLTQWLARQLPPSTAPFAQALVTGERGGISQQNKEDWARTGLAHLLAISGLHMSIVMGLSFYLLKRLFALIPSIHCRWDPAKLAILPAMTVGWVYLQLAGQAVPAQRAWMMGVVLLVGILLNREALSMRTLSFAALCILIAKPTLLFHVGFQLSFMAVLSLLALYEWQSRKKPVHKSFFHRIYQSCAASCMVTWATAPLILYTFHRLPLMGIPANMIAVPWTSFVVIPLGGVCLLTSLMNIHIETLWTLWHFSLQTLNQGATWLGQHTSDTYWPHPEHRWFLCYVGGTLWWALWQRPWRWLGGLAIIISIIGYLLTPLPFLIISDTGKTWGFYQDGVLKVSRRQERNLIKAWRASLGARHVIKLSSQPIPWTETTACGSVTLQESGWLLIHHPTQKVLKISPKDLQDKGTHSIVWKPTEFEVHTSEHL